MSIFQIILIIAGVTILLLFYRRFKDGSDVLHFIWVVLFFAPFFGAITDAFVDKAWVYTYPVYDATVINVEEVFHEAEDYDEEDTYSYEVTYSFVDDNNQKIEREGEFSSVQPPAVGRHTKVSYKDGKLIEYTFDAIGTLAFFFLFMLITFTPFFLVFLVAIGTELKRVQQIGLALLFKGIFTLMFLLFSATFLFKVWLALSGQEYMATGWMVGLTFFGLLFAWLVPSFYDERVFNSMTGGEKKLEEVSKKRKRRKKR